jgi:hypothetical protein
MMIATLIGSRKIERTELDTIEAPPATKTWSRFGTAP